MADLSSQRSPQRLDAITGLRWWAAFAVFVFHLRNLVPLPFPISGIAPFGYIGVTFFFVLSGFVLTWSWRPEVDKRTFWWRRFSRIYPLAFVTLLLAIPVFYSFNPDPAQPWVKPVDIGILVLCVFLLQGWFRDPTIMFAGNPASWTLTTEALFYATHPFLMPLLRRLTLIGSLVAGAGVLAFAFATRLYLEVNPTGLIAELPRPLFRMNEFVLGMCLAWAFRRGWLPRIPLLVPVALLALWFGTLAVTARLNGAEVLYGIVSPYTDEVATGLSALLIVAAASIELRGRARMMLARPLVALGEWSFAFYLVHATIIYALLNIFGRQPGGWHAVMWFVIVLTLSLVAAWALHVFLERPVEKKLRDWQSRRRRERLARRDPLQSETTAT